MSNVATFPQPEAALPPRRSLSEDAVKAEQQRNARAAAEAESIAEQAQLDIAAAKHRGIDIGRRVVFKGGEWGTTLHAWVRQFGSDSAGRAMVALQVFCNGPELVRVPLAGVQAVCGTCEECKHLADRPSCAR